MTDWQTISYCTCTFTVIDPAFGRYLLAEHKYNTNKSMTSNTDIGEILLTPRESKNDVNDCDDIENVAASQYGTYYFTHALKSISFLCRTEVIHNFYVKNVDYFVMMTTVYLFR